MAYTPINTILSWFETGDYPTQMQFAQSWSSFWHKGELIPLSSIKNIDVFMQQTTPIASFNAHINDSSAHSSILAKIDASNLSADNIISWKTALNVGVIPDNVALVDSGDSPHVYNKPQIDLKLANINVTLVSEDESILIDNDAKNIESNVSLISDEFEDWMTDLVVLSFPAIQILGVYDGGLKLNSNEYEIMTPTRIKISTARKYTLITSLPNMVEVQYTHLKTDI